MPVVRCRFCRAEDGDLVLDLGLLPACEAGGSLRWTLRRFGLIG